VVRREEQLRIHDTEETSRLASWLRAWPLPEPVAVRATTSGINNRTWFVDAPQGGWVLRHYQNTADPARVLYEHAILRALGDRSLPFGVPAPVPAHDGGTLVRLPDGDLVALFPLLPGEPPDRRSPAHVRACAAALGHLHAALASVDAGPPPGSHATYGEVERIHPHVPDPWSIAGDLGLPPDRSARLAAVLARVRGAAPSLYAELPAQLCHNDYSPGNTLQVGGRTSAVLDFEFAGPDLPALDVATGWYWSAGPTWGDGRELETAGWFLDGYRSVAPIGPAVAAAMPVLALLHRTAGLVHWLGRSRAGRDPHNRAAEHADRLLDLDAWLERHGHELIALAGG
jgi:homoserine kinase type II